jgi:hypothetical protein
MMKAEQNEAMGLPDEGSRHIFWNFILKKLRE